MTILDFFSHIVAQRNSQSNAKFSRQNFVLNFALLCGKISLFVFLLFGFLLNVYAEKRTRDTIPPHDSLCKKMLPVELLCFESKLQTGCQRLETQLLNCTFKNPIDTFTFHWSVYNDQEILFFNFEEENPLILIEKPGNYNVILTVNNSFGCSANLLKTIFFIVDEQPQIDFNFTPDNALFAEYFGEVEFINLTNEKYKNDTTITWYWDFGDSYTNNLVWEPVHLFSSWGDYNTSFYLETKYGCKVQLSKSVTIEDELFFPKELSKNQLSVSDIFSITNLNTNIPLNDPTKFRNNFLFIYNDKGVKVYEQENYDTYLKQNKLEKGNYYLYADELNNGSYYYSFYYKGKTKMVHYHGSFIVHKLIEY